MPRGWPAGHRREGARWPALREDSLPGSPAADAAACAMAQIPGQVLRARPPARTPGRRRRRGSPGRRSSSGTAHPRPRGPPILCALNDAASTSRSRRENGIFPSACTASVWMRILRPHPRRRFTHGAHHRPDVLDCAGLVVHEHHRDEVRCPGPRRPPRPGDPPAVRPRPDEGAGDAVCLEDAGLLVHGRVLDLRGHDPRLLPFHAAQPVPVQQREEERAVRFGSARGEDDLPRVHSQESRRTRARASASFSPACRPAACGAEGLAKYRRETSRASSRAEGSGGADAAQSR